MNQQNKPIRLKNSLSHNLSSNKKSYIINISTKYSHIANSCIAEAKLIQKISKMVSKTLIVLAFACIIAPGKIYCSELKYIKCRVKLSGKKFI